MTERPILFKGAMVRAILNGTKTQTRRVVKPWEPRLTNLRRPVPDDVSYLPDFTCYRSTCPYGAPGDRLWVRESHWWFKDEPDHETGYYPPKLELEDVEYRADGDDGRKVWRPSIHMPRWASRITLEVTGVRVERLQDISEADAIAEGCTQNHNGYFWGGPHAVSGLKQMATAVGAYRDLWQSINGPESWAANPWVWVVEFKPTEVPA